MSFADEVLDFSNHAIEVTDDITRVSAIALFSDVVISTPVGNPSLWSSKAPAGYTGGSLRGSWFATISRPSSQLADASRENSAISSMENIVLGAKSARLFYMTNNQPYSKRVEYDGWSSQAPDGMVRKNTARWDSIVKEISGNMSI